MSRKSYTPRTFEHGQVPPNDGTQTSYVGGFIKQPTVVVVHPKSLIVTYLLWFFLGYLGIHKFYLRQPFQGVFYMIITGLAALLTPIALGWIPGGLLLLLLFKDLFTNVLRVALLNAAAPMRTVY